MVNGRPLVLAVDPAKPLLRVLREDLRLTGVKQSCDMEGECGACIVIVDGVAQRACLVLAGEVEGRAVETVEGLAASGRPHPLQIAFLEAGAVQCGYCTPGMLMSAKALLDRNPRPTRGEIVAALAGNLCRCTGYVQIVEAVERAAAMLAEDGAQASEDAEGASSIRQPVIGGDLTRHRGWERVSGAALYAEDIVLPDMRHIAFVRSPHFHARVLSIDPAAALALPGVVRVLTAADVPGENIGLGGYSVGEHLLAPADGMVRMIGDPVAMVVAVDPETARAGAEAVRVAYEPLPHTTEIENALAPDAIQIHEGGNLLVSEEARRGDLDAALAGSAVVVQETYRTSFQAHIATEREAAVAYWETPHVLTVICGSHEPHWNRDYLATILALPAERIRVVTPPIGGSFGGRQDVYPLAAVALAAYHVRAPVKLAYTRREVMEAAPKRHPYTMQCTVGAQAGGQLTGMKVDIKVNTGAYDSAGRYIADYAVAASPGPYRWQAAHVHAQVIYSNGPKAGQFRGFGTPQAAFAMECMLDEVCQQLDLDPWEFRVRNALADGEPNGLGVLPGETIGFRQVLEALADDYRVTLASAAAFNADRSRAGRRRGVGLAGMMYRFGKFGVARSQAEAELALDGRIVIYASAGEFGQGIETVFMQMAAECMGVSRSVVQLVNADTAHTLDGDVTGASRATYWVGGAVADAARRLAAAILSTAAELLDRPPTALKLTDQAVIVAREPAVRTSLAAAAAEMERSGQPRRIRGVHDLTREFPAAGRSPYLPFFLTAAHLAEVEVDLETGQVQVLRVVAAHDVGKIINARDAVGQVQGGVMMGIGSALTEEYRPGQSRGFASYAIPTMTTMPEISVRLVETPARYGPFGARGLGEATILPTPPAVINAVSRAIGVRIRRTPATAEMIQAALRAAARASLPQG